MDIDIRELEAFASVVEQGSFSKAAKALFLTQPTVSSHVADLERKLNIKLLIRASRAVYPSEAGRLLYGYAQEILKLRTEAVEAIATFSQEMRGTIYVAASATPGQYYLPQMIQRFRTRYPDIHFNVQLLSSKAVAAQVAARKVDLGFTGAVVSLPTCIYQTLTEDRLVIVTPDTPLYRSYLAAGFPPRQIARESFISREPDSHSRMETEHFLRSIGIHPRDLHIAVEVRSTAAILQMVSEGVGIAVVPNTAYRNFCRLQPLLSFDFDSVNLRQKIYLVHHKNNVFSPIAQAFVHDVSAYYTQSEHDPSNI